MRSFGGLARKRIAIAVAIVVVGAFVAWAAAPLFFETRQVQPPPGGITQLVRQGVWQGADDFHYARGIAKILTDGNGTYVLRLEEFSVRNGPDIHFFLSSDSTVGPGDVDLGTVPATTGSYNVAVPGGVDIDAVHFVIVHCVPFNVPFGQAALE